MGGHVLHKGLADGVPGQPGIPVGVTHLTVGDDERRVADDEIELVALDRLEQ